LNQGSRAMHPAKTCLRCGRDIEWRARWAHHWEEIRYCSKACRSHRLQAIDGKLEEAILHLLATRPARATICPSEAARSLGADDWKALMESTRQAARRLVAKKRVLITQSGHVVDPSTAKGPIRIQRGPGFFTPAQD
jgi:hypothetical protein